MEETEDEEEGVEETDEINETDVEREVDKPEVTIIAKLKISTTIFNSFYYVSAYSRSQTCEAFSYHVVINSTQLHYRYLYS